MEIDQLAESWQATVLRARAARRRTEGKTLVLDEIDRAGCTVKQLGSCELQPLTARTGDGSGTSPVMLDSGLS